MNGFLNENEEFFTKEKIEELILLHNNFVKGMTYIIDEIPTKKQHIRRQIDFYDINLKPFKLEDDKFPSTITYLGAHDEVIRTGEHASIIGKFKASIDGLEKEFYSPIIYFSGEKRVYDSTIGYLYKIDSNLIDFYIPGIFTALNESGYGIQYINHSKNEELGIRIRVKTYQFRINTRIIQDYFDETAANKIVKATKELQKFSEDFNRNLSNGLEPRYTEGEKTISLADLIELMRINDIDFEDVKINHKGISSIYDTGLFEEKLPDFISFISESDTTSTTPNRDAAIYYLTNLSRNYTTVTSGIKNPAFENLGEKIRLQELRLHVKDSETNTCDGYREIHCKINDDEVLFKFDFDVKFSGQKESDSPDAGEIDKDAVFVRLEDFIPTKFEISSPRVNKVYTNFSKELKENIQLALVGLFEAWYDILGKDLERLKITQV